jgi:hypothetical protein
MFRLNDIKTTVSLKSLTDGRCSPSPGEPVSLFRGKRGWGEEFIGVQFY